MEHQILEELASRQPRLRDEDEVRLNGQIRQILSRIKKHSIKPKNIKSSRGGLSSMGARGVFLKEGGIFSRRVIVKASYILSSAANARARIRHHLTYVGRNTLDQSSRSVELYTGDNDVVELASKLRNFERAPHMFNLIVSPEDGDKLDLKAFSRDFIAVVEKDLSTKIDWVAGNHYDTNDPHVHILIKGQTSDGKKLLIKPDYISRGLRVRASQVINNKLGLRSRDDVLQALRLDAGKSKKCALDDVISRNIQNGVLNTSKLVQTDILSELFRQRLEFLQAKQLAKRVDDGHWSIKEDYLDELKRLERSASIIEKLSGKVKVGAQNCEVLSVNNLTNRTIQGHVVERGYVDEISEREYLLVKAKDKSFVYVELEKYSEKSKAVAGEFVRIETTKAFAGAMRSDQNISVVAQSNHGFYDAKVHAKSIATALPPGVSAKDYVDVHLKRLEVLARQGFVEKISDERFKIPKGYLDRLRFEASKSVEGHRLHIKVTRLAPGKTSKPSLTLRPN